MTEDDARLATRDGTLTSRCGAVVGTGARRWRMTFRRAGQACRPTLDAIGTFLSASRFPSGYRLAPLPDPAPPPNDEVEHHQIDSRCVLS